MDRRTKLILLIIGSVILLGTVLWFFVWPLLQPEIQKINKAQPPALTEPNPQVINTGTQNTGTSATEITPGNYKPTDINPDLLQITDMSRRAGILAERIESGSNEEQFRNLNDAALDASAKLAAALATKRAALEKQYPVSGPAFSTQARALAELPESEIIQQDTFHITVQLQVRTLQNGKSSTGYLESIVTYQRNGANWNAVDYQSAPLKQ